jgi:hypothetical protein
MSCRVTETVTVHSRWRAEFCDQPKQFPTGRFSLELAHRFDAFISLLQTIGTEAWFIQKESQVTQINGRKAERNANQCTSIRSRRTSSFRAALRGSACSGQEGSGICSSLICLVIHNCPAAGIWSKRGAGRFLPIEPYDGLHTCSAKHHGLSTRSCEKKVEFPAFVSGVINPDVSSEENSNTNPKFPSRHDRVQR